MAARAMTPVRMAAFALLAGLLLAPAPPARSAAEEQKVWRALAEGEPRRAAPPATRPAAASGTSAEPFPSEVALAVVVAAVVAAMLAVGARQAGRKPAPPVAREPEEPEAGSSLERLWRSHLRGRRPKPGPGA